MIIAIVGTVLIFVFGDFYNVTLLTLLLFSMIGIWITFSSRNWQAGLMAFFLVWTVWCSFQNIQNDASATIPAMKYWDFEKNQHKWCAWTKNGHECRDSIWYPHKKN